MPHTKAIIFPKEKLCNSHECSCKVIILASECSTFGEWFIDVLKNLVQPTWKFACMFRPHLGWSLGAKLLTLTVVCTAIDVSFSIGIFLIFNYALYAFFSIDAPSVTQDMLQWQIIEGFPNISIVIEFNIPEDNIVTKLSYSLSVFSSLGLELQVLERSLNTTLSCDTKYWVIGTVSNDCGSDNVTVTIPPQGKYKLCIRDG